MPNRVTHRHVLVVAVALVLSLLAALSPANPASAAQPVGHLPTAADFATQQYEDFLSRGPDGPGLDYWTELVQNGMAPAALVESLAQSAEFEGTIAPVVRLYYAHFQRPPDYEGLSHWAGVARRGTSMGKISDDFAKSREFINTYGSLTDEQYVERVYLNVLGRSADSGGRTYWTGQMAAGRSRGEVMLALSESSEYRRIIGARVQATMLYVGMLRRAPDPSGLTYWAQVIGSGVPYRDVIAGFLDSPEYGVRMAAIYHDVHPLTGVPTKAAAQRPALAIKIDNVDNARPQTNVDRADLVYEEMVEGNLTRLIAVFHSDLPDVVGPVRSVRTTDIHVLDQFNNPLLAASGANAKVLAAVAAADVVNVNAHEAGAAYYRDSGRRAPHNMYTRPDKLHEAAAGRGGQPPQLFNYRTPGTAPVNGASSSGVSIRFGRANIDFGWSYNHRGWVRTQNGKSHMMADGSRLAPANVVVLEVDYGASPADFSSPEAHTVGSGRAFVFTDGQLITGTWSRGSSHDRIVVKDLAGNEILLSRGQTFIELAPPGSITLK